MGTIFLNFLRDKKTMLIIFCLAAIAMVWMYVAMFPSIQEKSADFDKLMEAYPQEILQAMNIETLSFERIENFLAMENYSIIWPLLMFFLAISLAGFALVREVDSGTAEILLSRPLSRSKIFLARYLAGLVSLVVFTLVSVYAIIPWGEIYKVDYDLGGHSKLLLMNLLFAWAIFSLAMLCSAWFSEKGKAYGAISGLLVLMYVFNIIAGLKEELEDLHYASFFYYFNYFDALVNGELAWLNIAVFVGTALISTIISWLIWQKRDLAV